MIDNFEELKDKAIRISSSLDSSLRRVRSFEKNLEESQEGLNDKLDEREVHLSAMEHLKAMIDALSSDQLRVIKDLVTFGLQTIFYDKNYSFDIELDDKRSNKVADFILVEEVGDEVRRLSFEDDIGGGIKSVVGFILQVYYIGYFKFAPILFCDESFTQLSSKYIDGLAQFIDKLAEKKGFIIPLIAHDVRFTDLGNRVYVVEEGKVRELEEEKE